MAHPDDESMGNGGLILRHTRAGIPVYLVCATRGGEGWGVAGHYGLQSIHNHQQFTDVTGAPLSKNVGDYKVGVTKDLSGWVVGAAVVGTSKKNYFGTTALEAGGKTKLLVSVSKTF